MEKIQNTLYTGDNLYILHGLNSEIADLIYIDPPFNSKRMYSAPVGSKAAGSSFKDMWSWADVDVQYLNSLATDYPILANYIASVGTLHSKAMMAYLTYMAQRIIEMHRILKDTGSFYLHCDSTASHYLKNLLDGVFGKNNFRNEIIWHYSRWTGKSKKLQELHDVIFFYTKSDDYIFNEQSIEYTEKSLKRKQHHHTRIKGDDIFVTSIDEKGVRDNDVWQIQLLNSQSKERTGYPTQKPLTLLHKIIKMSSNPGDLVLDAFCGCATACVAPQQLDRKWIGIDIAENSADILVERLSDDAGLFKNFISTKLIPKRTDLKEEPITKSVKERLFEEQENRCNGCGKEFELHNLEVDHIIPKAKGGGDYYENYQLLCSSCNKLKGARPMEYLRMKIATREAMMKDKIIFGE